MYASDVVRIRKIFGEKRYFLMDSYTMHSPSTLVLLGVLSFDARTSEKRELINLVFWNLKLKGQRLVYTLHLPFDMFMKSAKNGEWWAWQDLNPRPNRYERFALTN